MDQKIKALLFGTALLTGCTTLDINVKDQRDNSDRVVDCKENHPPKIYVIKDKDIIVNVLISDVDKNLEAWDWKIEQNYVYAIDKCGAMTIYDNGKITTIDQHKRTVI